jgi:soluble lytic murein transglycosylase-like protein
MMSNYFLINNVNLSMSNRVACAIACVMAAALFAPNSAYANIYAFKDEYGVTHFSNLPHLDKRYKLVYRIPTSAQMRPNAWSANGPRVVDIEKLVPIIANAARTNGLDAKLVHAVIRAESGYNENAVSSKGAVGLMQLIPATAQRYGVVNSYDATENISGGARYLRDLLKLFNGNVELALAGYNAGENAVIRAGNRIPPYPETMAYVPKVLNFYRSPDVSRF